MGFGGSEIMFLGTIDLPTSIGVNLCRRTLVIKYLVVDVLFVYNVILGQPGLNHFEAVVLTYHMKMKFLMIGRVGEVSYNLKKIREYYDLSLKRKENVQKTVQARFPTKSSMWKIKQIARKEDECWPSKKMLTPNKIRIEPYGEYKTIELEPENSKNITRISIQMNLILELLMVNFLKDNTYIFAWKPTYLQGIDPEVIVHRLKVNLNVKLVKQKRWNF